MCEQYSTQALSYLNQNETQTEILSLLYKTCSKLQPLRQQVQIIVIKVLSPQNCTVEGNWSKFGSFVGYTSESSIIEWYCIKANQAI
jgi:Saposin-like type B, region 1